MSLKTRALGTVSATALLLSSSLAFAQTAAPVEASATTPVEEPEAETAIVFTGLRQSLTSTRNI